MENKLTANYTTRSQILKNKEDMISKQEERIQELESIIKTYEKSMCNLNSKLKDRERLISTMVKEQDENIIEYERMCKENTNLKKKLAQTEVVTIDLRNQLLKLTDINLNLSNENDEVCNTNNSMIIPLQNKCFELQTENSVLHKKIAQTINEFHSLDQSNRKYNDDVAHLNYFSFEQYKNKKINKKIRKQAKKIRNLESKIRVIRKWRNNIKNKTNVRKKIQTLVTDNTTQLSLNQKQLCNSNEAINDIRIIGDISVRGLGLLLLDKLNEKCNIYCETHSFAPMQTIITSAENIIRKENNIILVVILNSIKEEEILSFYSKVLQLIQQVKEKNIKLVITNIPYLQHSVNYNINYDIYRFNSKLNSISILNNNVQIINIVDVKLNKINIKNLQKILVYNISSLYKNLIKRVHLDFGPAVIEHLIT